MAKGEDSAVTRISTIFDWKSRCSLDRSSTATRDSNLSSGSGRHKGHRNNRARYRSSSSSSRSSSRSRSRSHPRCHRRSSCGLSDDHGRYGPCRSCHSPNRRWRAHCPSYSRCPSVGHYQYRRSYRSRSRSPRGGRKAVRVKRVVRDRFNRSPSRSYCNLYKSPTTSVTLSLGDKQELSAAKDKAFKLTRMVKKLHIPESVKSILSQQPAQSDTASRSRETRLRQDLKKTPLQSQEEKSDLSSPRVSPKKGVISFSVHNSVTKPTAAAPSSAKVNARVDSYDSRKPYGNWIPVGSAQSSTVCKHTLLM